MKMRNTLYLFMVSTGLCYCISCGSQQDAKRPVVVIQTGYGDMEILLFRDKAPRTVDAFVKLVKQDAYRDATFYRVTGAEGSGILQGGIHRKPNHFTAPFIPHESTAQTGLSHTSGMISMARTKPGTASSEFFICIGDQSPLDAGRRGSADGEGYAIFGEVIRGMKTVRKIHEMPSSAEELTEPVLIQRIRLK